MQTIEDIYRELNDAEKLTTQAKTVDDLRPVILTLVRAARADAEAELRHAGVL